jgi:hypothetical protein
MSQNILLIEDNRFAVAGIPRPPPSSNETAYEAESLRRLIQAANLAGRHRPQGPPLRTQFDIGSFPGQRALACQSLFDSLRPQSWVGREVSQ